MARPRGFIEGWEPKPHVQQCIDNVNAIINSCGIAPLTLRQLFYMLNTDYGTPKTQKFYKNLCEWLNKARRAQMVSMDDIRDEGLLRKPEHSPGWENKEQLLDYIHGQTSCFTLERMLEQPRMIYVWCETAGMVQQVYDAVKEYHIPVLSSGGFDSVTTKHSLAKELADVNDPIILHLGDYDPSGVHMYGSLNADLNAFLEAFDGSVDLYRIAVTPEQGEEWNLPTAPVKESDNRSFDGNATIQCEAIRPEKLKELVVDNVEMWLDMDLYEKTLEKEVSVRGELKVIFKDLGD